MTELAVVLVSIGVLFDIFGCVGLVRMPDVYNRLQAGTKCVTLGTWAIMVGVALLLGWSGGGFKAVMCAFFVLLTSPVAAHAIARAAHLSGIKLWEESVVDQYQAPGEKAAQQAPRA